MTGAQGPPDSYGGQSGDLGAEERAPRTSGSGDAVGQDFDLFPRSFVEALRRIEETAILVGVRVSSRQSSGFGGPPAPSGGFGGPPTQFGGPPAQSGGFGGPPAQSGGYGGEPSFRYELYVMFIYAVGRLSCGYLLRCSNSMFWRNSDEILVHMCVVHNL